MGRCEARRSTNCVHCILGCMVRSLGWPCSELKKFQPDGQDQIFFHRVRNVGQGVLRGGNTAMLHKGGITMVRIIVPRKQHKSATNTSRHCPPQKDANNTKATTSPCPPRSPRWCTTRRRSRERSASHILTGSWWLSTCLISSKYRHNHSCVAPKHTEVFKVAQTQRVKSGKMTISIIPQ